MRQRRPAYIFRPIRPVNRFTRADAPDRLLWLDATTGVKARGAAQFALSSGQFLQIQAPDAGLRVGTGDFLCACWVRHDSFAGANPHYFRKYSAISSAKIDYHIFFNSSTNRFRFRLDNNAGGFQVVDANTFGAPSTGVWYFVAAYYDKSANAVGISVNGATPNTATFSGTPLDDTNRFVVGAAYNGTTHDGFHNGAIDQLVVCKGTDLDIPALIADLYNGGSGRSAVEAPASATAFYELDERSGTRFDSIGGNHLADTTTATSVDGIIEGPADDLDPARVWDNRVAVVRFEEASAARRPTYTSTGYLDFDGVDDRLGHPAVIVGNRQAFTLLARIRLDTLPTTLPAVVYTESDGTGGVANRLAIAPGGNVVASYRPVGGTLASASSAGSLVAGTDAVVAVRRDGTALQVFINGQPSGLPATIGAGTDLTGATARVGGPVESGGFAHLDGRIYDVFAVGRALSDTQIASLSS
ncbi:LamG domain-containing protein [Tautonia plasticadhaerens]|uniref:LamG-like jellyroll fold domain-containing protein n=1 Tax=Tautonia plasticadhaerens TaxID=2527974 RepID=A0A518H609_9BACT|nr:LamG domain-containing protein [Tautonia plasticadhaerens]QDV36248.1 hypothetical protein ElP_41670 [Tautonia plasticadhaerens]